METEQQDLSGLIPRMRACRLCADLPLGPNPLFQLSPGTRILIAGQAPGRLTHAKGRPFDDPSGVRLRGWLGLSEAGFYEDPRVGIFPMGLCFPGSGTGGDLPPRVECAQAWRGPVMGALGGLELSLVLGKYAIDWHLPQLKGASVTEAVRQTSQGEGGIFVLPHPSPRNNRWLRNNPWFEGEVLGRIRAAVGRALT
ncbi:uracil-DNA glycosylase family protein [Alphaproteobacteria bacterium KMM 3653]|uniref:Uracil-DNA glycosylase family protein n=1 Tax=Harenicola maris TaxID=2841044 RepID=A0AAP2G8V3_9RHOB|nr:uracil-DNA glycosylase family protein [Harenicola maris]